MSTINVNKDYSKERKSSYPSVGDQLDAIFKAIDSIAGSVNIGDDALKMLSEIKSIKSKYPKDM